MRLFHASTLGDALNAGFGYLEVKCLGCNTHQTVALDIVRRPRRPAAHDLRSCDVRAIREPITEAQVNLRSFPPWFSTTDP